ncbi:MAG: T9SS type A sorting domain-containing protein, partial [Bacteroidales bacterium]|nr:T9SS type A sorting domain-containing protein [Bacteroidales bacterium]
GLVYIFNSAGSVVKSVLLEGKQKNIDVSVLASGNYFISFIPKSGQSFSGQFVKE